MLIINKAGVYTFDNYAEEYGQINNQNQMQRFLGDTKVEVFFLFQ